MNRTELIAALARRFPVLTEQDAALSVKYLLDAITGAVAYGSRIEVRGFGSFGVRVCPLPKAHDPKTGEAVAVGTKYVPHFTTGKALRQRVDHSSHP